MKNKIITLILSISCMILIACNTESIEPVATVESIESVEMVTEVVEETTTEQGTVEGYEATSESTETEATAEPETYTLDEDIYVEPIAPPELKEDGLDEGRQELYDLYQQGIMTEEEYLGQLESLNGYLERQEAYKKQAAEEREAWIKEHQAQNPAVDREPPKIGSGQLSDPNQGNEPAKLNKPNPEYAKYRIN